MRKLPYFVADVFAQQKYQGNQVAVFRDTVGLSDVEMQSIARETNYSETTFILSDEPRNGGYDVRIFTPGEEIKFAGHPTLGTAYIIGREIVGQPVPQITLNLKVGQIPVAFAQKPGEAETLWMKQVAPSFGAADLTAEALAKVLGLAAAEIDERFPIEEVSTGLPHIIVPLKRLKSVQDCRVDVAAYNQLIAETWAKSILVFSPETVDPENHVHVRVFAGYYRVPEDPATGSGNGCLTGYLVKHGYFGRSEISLRSEQGLEMGRPSLLHLQGSEANGVIDIRVGGRVVLVARGEWL